jgi:hypothetical protein
MLGSGIGAGAEITDESDKDPVVYRFRGSFLYTEEGGRVRRND